MSSKHADPTTPTGASPMLTPRPAGRQCWNCEEVSEPCYDGAAILRDGVPVSISELLTMLSRQTDALIAKEIRKALDDMVVFGNGYLMIARDTDGRRNVKHIQADIVSIRRDAAKDGNNG